MGSPTDQIRVRRNAWILDEWDDHLLAYAHAVREMQSRPVEQTTSWLYQANIHGVPPRENPPPGMDWNQCQHATWFFLPWHRMYIYWFEQIVRSIVAEQHGPEDWALPYWNYSDDQSQAGLPPAFRARRLPDNTLNPLFVEKRSPEANAGDPMDETTSSYALAFGDTNFTPPPSPGFGGPVSGFAHRNGAFGDLESQPHNVVHGFVGGTDGLMSYPAYAARDPIFWLHHSNIDRLWTRWLTQPGRSNPADDRWLTFTFTLVDAQGDLIQMVVRDVLDSITQLQYRYDDQAEPAGVPAPEPVAEAVGASAGGGGSAGSGPAEDSGRQEVAATEGVTLRGATETVSAPIPADAPALAAAAPPGAGRHVTLEIEGVEYVKNPGIVYDVYLDLPEEGGGQPEHHFVGLLTFFGQAVDEKEHHGGHELVHTYDITDLVNQLRAAGRWDEEKVTVTLVPHHPSKGALSPDEERYDVPEVRIGRIRIITE